MANALSSGSVWLRSVPDCCKGPAQHFIVKYVKQKLCMNTGMASSQVIANYENVRIF